MPDNLKSGVHKASFYDPELNRSYAMMAAHYGVGILPARPRRPRDKAKGEAGVRLAQSYILGRLRRQTFRSEEHTSELQSLMRISYAVFCLNKKKHIKQFITSTVITYLIIFQ